MIAPTRMPRLYVGLGAVTLLISLLLNFALPDERMTDTLLMALVAAGTVLLGTGLYLRQQQTPSAADERFLLHRLKSSRFGLLLGLVTIFALFFYHALAGDKLPWDLVAVAAAMALGKLAAMAYFKATG
jgi:hypothetical protein